MRCRILHESNGRLRVHVVCGRMTMAQADLLEYYLRALPFVTKVSVSDRTGNAIVRYAAADGRNRAALIEAFRTFSWEDARAAALVPEKTGRAMNRQYEERLVMSALGQGFRRVFFPLPLRVAWTAVKSVRFLWRGISALMREGLTVSVLDALAILVSMLRGDFETASSVMFLLDAGDLLEEWTHRKSVDDLARAMSLKIEQVWLQTPSGEVLTDVRKVRVSDRLIVRTSHVIPLDGRIVEGEVMVNQSSMTGESLPVAKTVGGYVYAGTVVEEGECVVEVTQSAGSGRYDRIVRMIEESEKLKSGMETKAFRLADSLVSWSLAGTALTWLLTRDVTRSISFLMVDFSCALKLSMPLAVLSAIGEAEADRITVKGGKFLEAVAEADTIIFDKTGTLTDAAPQLVELVTFGGADETECLKIAACLEEHYPHSVAGAIVEAARRRGIRHDEMHSRVAYVVAHGIASTIDGEKAVIGSYHFVFEDEGCLVPPEEAAKLEALPEEYSQLYLAIGGMLVAVLCIFDPLRKEAADVVDALHAAGIKRVCMLTGDNRRTAAAIARQLHLDAYEAEMLPEDKAALIRREHAAGRKVVMVGDGVNDTPALSEADVGIAVSSGAAIAREVADITIASGSLWQLLTLRQLSMLLTARIRRNYRFILSFNSLLIALGVSGILTPASSALLHNTSTIVTGLNSMRRLQEKPADAGHPADAKHPAVMPASADPA